MRPSDIGFVARKLSLHSALSAEAESSLIDFLGHSSQFHAGAMIAQAGEAADLITIVGDGVACRMNILPGGGRQIHSILLEGDAADVEASLLATRSDSIQAITACRVWSIPKKRLAALVHSSPALMEAFLREATITAEITREWVVNLGRRAANERMAHLVCELCTRMDAMGGGVGGVYPWPFTQQDIADAQGLSVVHVNRVMQHHRALGVFEVTARRLRVLNRRLLEETAGFDAGYLHFQNVKAA